MSAVLVYHSKIHLIHLIHRVTDQVALAELKVWRVPVDKSFPEGIKYSLFLVEPQGGEVILGYDNHKPKGHHKHIGKREKAYVFVDSNQLIEDFWSAVEKQGYLVT